MEKNLAALVFSPYIYMKLDQLINFSDPQLL